MPDFTVSQFLNLIPRYVIDIAEKLQANNFEAYLVGGSIRDVLLGKTPDDYDIATNAQPEEIVKIFERSIPTGAKFGTITVIGEDQRGERFDVQVTTYRSEADYFGGRWPAKVEFATNIKDDLSRRDFTINAIALNLQHFDETDVLIKEILVDPFSGVDDLSSKLIKAVREPLERFTEDGLRGVRACRLASQLGFTIENATFEAIKSTLHITKMVSVERFKDELMKLLLKSPKPSVGLKLLKDTGIMEIFIPELLEGIEVVQPEFHEDDVFDHILKTVDFAEDSVKLAALFHDIAKPRCRTEDEHGIHFYGHDVEGAKMTEIIMRRLKFSNAEVEAVSRLVRWHMFYYPSADWRVKNSEQNEVNFSPATPSSSSRSEHGWTDGAIRRLIQNAGGEEAIDELMKLRIADATANPKSEFNPKELDVLSQRISEVRAKEMALKISDLDISGEDLMKAFNLQPGKEIGDVLKHLLEIVVEEPANNKNELLLKLAGEYIQNTLKK
jgi:tRNA nucleotidyltransferase (CCA-adding enzyme)